MANDTRGFNFSAGPSMLPLEVLERAAAEMTNYKGTGMSVMEMSHRSKAFLNIFEDAKERFSRLLGIPEGYGLLFLQGGASTQFSMVPLNLIGKTGKADYAVTGHFANVACQEAQRYGEVRLAASSKDRGHTYIPGQEALDLSPDAAYFHYCANNTICGTEWNYVPETGSVPVVCDMSSNLLSRPVDVSKFGILYGGAQKNLAPAGLTVAVVREDLLGAELPFTPLMLSYKRNLDKDSMYNTPPCWCIYILGLVCEHLENLGGIPAMEQRNIRKSQMLYDCLDQSKLFRCPVEPASRSRMNVVFRSGDEDMDARFVTAATEAGFTNLKGHRSVGGMRASIYNAMPEEGVAQLCDFIRSFEKSV